MDNLILIPVVLIGVLIIAFTVLLYAYLYHKMYGIRLDKLTMKVSLLKYFPVVEKDLSCLQNIKDRIQWYSLEEKDGKYTVSELCIDEGEVPESLEKLENLKYFRLDGANDLTGNIPDSFNFTKMTDLTDHAY